MSGIILVKDQLPAFVRDDGMKANVSFPDLPEPPDQDLVAIDADTPPAFQVEVEGIGFLDRVIATDVHIIAITPGLSEDCLDDKVVATLRIRDGKTFHFYFLKQPTQEIMQARIPEEVGETCSFHIVASSCK